MSFGLDLFDNFLSLKVAIFNPSVSKLVNIHTNIVIIYEILFLYLKKIISIFILKIQCSYSDEYFRIKKM